MIADQVTIFKKKLIAENKCGLALDIDETISATTDYWFAVMRKKFGNPENLTTKELIAKYRYSHDVPYWQTEEAFAWMEEQRNSNELQKQLPLIEGADTAIQEINSLIPIIIYITTRPQAVLEGTKEWLKRHHFPIVDIIARPAGIPITDANTWKAEVLASLYPEVMGIIDDNPTVVASLPNGYKGAVFLYDNIGHPRKDVRVIAGKTWRDLVEKMKRELL